MKNEAMTGNVAVPWKYVNIQNSHGIPAVMGTVVIAVTINIVTADRAIRPNLLHKNLCVSYAHFNVNTVQTNVTHKHHEKLDKRRQ